MPKIVLGRLRWTEREFYISSPEGVFYACEGYFDERQELEEMFRTLGYNIHMVMGGKSVGKGRYWPMVKDSKTKAAEPVVKVWGDTPQELIERAMKVHNVN